MSLSVLEEEKSKLKEVTEMFFVLTHWLYTRTSYHSIAPFYKVLFHLWGRVIMTSLFLDGLDRLQEDTQVSWSLLAHCSRHAVDGSPLVQTHLNSNWLFNTEASLLLFTLFFMYGCLYLCSWIQAHHNVFNPRPLS